MTTDKILLTTRSSLTIFIKTIWRNSCHDDDDDDDHHHHHNNNNYYYYSNNIKKYTQSDSLKVLFDDSPRNKRSPWSLRQQSTATVGVSVMQCLITLFNHAEISLIRSEDCLLCLWRVESVVMVRPWSIDCIYALAHTSLPGMCRASFCLSEIFFSFLLHG